MGAQEKAIVQRWFDEVWNARRDDTIDELLDDNASVRGLGQPQPGLKAREQFRQFKREFCEAFPDLKVNVAQMVGEGEDVAVRLECVGCPSGAPAGARPLRFGAMCFVKVRDNRLVDGWNLVDQAAMTQGLQAAGAVG